MRNYPKVSKSWELIFAPQNFCLNYQNDYLPIILKPQKRDNGKREKQRLLTGQVEQQG